MTPEEYSQMVPTITVLPADVYDDLVEWLDSDDGDYPKLRALLQRPRVFGDCE